MNGKQLTIQSKRDAAVSYVAYRLEKSTTVWTVKGQTIGKKGEWILLDKDGSVYLIPDETIQKLFTIEEIPDVTETNTPTGLPERRNGVEGLG